MACARVAVRPSRSRLGKGGTVRLDSKAQKAFGPDTVHQLQPLFNRLFGIRNKAGFGLHTAETILQTLEPAAGPRPRDAAAGSLRSPPARSAIPAPFEAQKFAAYSISGPED